jgi:molecular chaperone DnaJ
MAARADYYEILGCARDADGATLKAAYRKLAMQYHPDRNGGCTDSESKFKDVNEAYAVLSDPQKRAAYDRFGHGGVNGGGAGGAQAADFADIFDSVFGDIFGRAGAQQRRQRAGPARGADLRADIEIALEDAFAGKEAKIAIRPAMPCEPCSGSGAAPGTKPETCPTCAGQGRVRTQQGIFTMERTCPRCGGQGRYVADPCRACDGVGLTRDARTLSVAIPAGVEDGTRIRLAGEGDSGMRGGPRGDLYLFVSVAPHELFERDGADLYCRASVQMATAALGGGIEAPTIDGGKECIDVPAGAQTGKKMRVRGKGMSQLRSPARGDLYVELFVETPRKLTPEQRECLEKFRDLTCEDCECHPEATGFVSKVKKFWDAISASPDGRPHT